VSETPIDREALRRLAEQATPGPWTYFPKPKYGEHHVSLPPAAWSRADDGPPLGLNGMNLQLFEDGCPTGQADAQFIATFNPATVLALLDELAQVEQRADQAEATLTRVRVLLARHGWGVVGDSIIYASELDAALTPPSPPATTTSPKVGG
jgi:hypothetical protein